MTEILTESFCERCGTRYTFETVQQRSRPLGRLGTLGRGLKHFVVIPEASFDEAMAVARSEEEQRVTTAQLDAFHRTFNFCLSCRQYTCADCWNGVEGRCLSCAPMPVDVTPIETVAAIAAPVEAPAMPAAAATLLPPLVVEAALAPEPHIQPELEPELQPELEPESQSQLEPEEAPGSHLEASDIEAPAHEPEVAVELVQVGLEGVVASEPVPDEPTAAIELDVSPAPAVPFPTFQQGRSLDDEIAAYEIRIAALAEAPPPEEAPASDPSVEAPAAAPGTLELASTNPAEPIAMKPPRSQRAAPEPSRPAPPVAARREAGTPEPAATRQPAATLDAAEQLTAAPPAAPSPVGAGTCRTCGLSISASARFCRRCGTRQDAA